MSDTHQSMKSDVPLSDSSIPDELQTNRFSV